MRLSSAALTVGLVVGLFGAVGCAPADGTDGGVAFCEAGTQGCPCVADRCGKSDRGEQLLCMGNVCETMQCPAGEQGCVCRAGTTCNGPGDACTNGFCLAANCQPGGANCGCVAGTCEVGLTCLESTVCVDSTGYEGGRCLPTGSCYRGNRCDNTTSTCVYCDPGTPGCQCNANNACNGGLTCAAGQCLAASMLPPANPKCFTPCQSDRISDGGRIVCGADHLMPGCFDTQSCVQGSCLAPGMTPKVCAGDLDCAFFQVCLQGGCYSNCDVHAECGSGMGCDRHACRPTCRVGQGQATCPAGTACTANDGQNGYCTPVGTSSGAASTLPTGGLSLPVGNLALSNVQQVGDAIVIPNSAITQDVTVRRLWHEITYSDGSTERVDAPRANGAYRTCDAAANECPLWWLKVGATGVTPTADAVANFRLPPNCVDDVSRVADGGPATPCPRIRVENAGGVTAVRWQGMLEVSSGDTKVDLTLSYVERPEGQWVGSMFYFGTFNRTGLDAWIGRADKADVNGVENGLLRRWGAFRGGLVEDGWPEFLAVLTSTRNESWKFAEVKSRCLAANNTGACYPYSNSEGVRSYVTSPTAEPIPSGVSELPIAMNLKIDTLNPALFQGRVESSVAMHYPGNPSIKLEFNGSPAVAGSCDARSRGLVSTDCLVFLKDVQQVSPGINQLVSTVGGRTLAVGGNCPTDFAAVRVPWLVPGFNTGTSVNPTMERERVECRDMKLPFDSTVDAKYEAINIGLAGGNPVPDGNPRERTLRFLDGALVNQSEIFILFEESYASFIPGQPEPTTAYGYMRLRRAAANLQATDYAGAPTTTAVRTAVAGGATCSPDLLASMGLPATPTPAQLASVVKLLLDGRSTVSGYTPIDTSNAPANRIHYWCEDTGLFNGGKGDLGNTNDVKVACPAGSKVIFFNAGATTAAAIAAEACQDPNQVAFGADGRAKCFDRLTSWITSGNTVTEQNPVYRCTSSAEVYCDDNRRDLRAGKTFFIKPSSVTTAPADVTALEPLIASAFRYKTRFRSSSGGSLGFAPEKCIANSDSVPYCYDPKEIEQARERIDCLVDIYSRPGMVVGLGGAQPILSDAAGRSEMLSFLQSNFSNFPGATTSDGGVLIAHEGFERLNAELLIMQGDESLTSAYASRFDLAAAGGATFRGSAFETGGIDLTGVAGAEMYRLYQAVQYYQLALDRLYMLGPNMRTALSLGAVGNPNDFLRAETVTTYLERLVRAASQKSRAWAEVARRYQNFNRPDLARSVIERAYVSTYLESALISGVMMDISKGSGALNRNQITITIEKAQRSYRMALLDMREVYQQITDEVNYFGYPADYIPFPALDSASTGSGNAYEVIAALARQRLDLAKTREQVALAAGRQGRVDAVQFQADLTSVRNTYENQLAQACGVFTGSNGHIYPAIKKYAALDPTTVQMGDPCGRRGNGDIHNAMANAKDADLRLKGVLQRHENILQDIAIERQRVHDVCGLMNDAADYQFTQSGVTSNLVDEMARQRAMMGFITGSVKAVMDSIGILDCEIQCASSAAMAASSAVMGVAAAGTQYASDLRIATQEKKLREFDATTVKTVAGFQCAGGLSPDGTPRETGILDVESNAKIATMLNDTLEVELEALRAEYTLRVAVAEVGRMFSSAQRVQAQQEEAEQLSIDLQQAQNDPNVRIYQNDAIINADVSFRDALATAYRLTRVFEYYTSQSYAKKEQLFLIRMVSAGQYNLENYLIELDNELITFEEQFGNPDIRVMVLSLRDDIMRIPYLATSGQALDENTRIGLMRERLRDVKMLDSHGYLTIPFSTALKELSPVTRNHKVRHVEIDLQGVKMGDSVARAYLRMSGTGVVRNVSDDIDYYVFPERLAVVNASLLGSKVFDPEVYRNYRFRDRPLVNTLWELVLNQRDESVNKDIDLQSLTDIRILIYYSDLTSF